MWINNEAIWQLFMSHRMTSENRAEKLGIMYIFRSTWLLSIHLKGLFSYRNIVARLLWPDFARNYFWNLPLAEVLFKGWDRISDQEKSWVVSSLTFSVIVTNNSVADDDLLNASNAKELSFSHCTDTKSSVSSSAKPTPKK